IQGNYIGVDVTGAVALENSAGGLVLQNGATNNVVGGTTPEARNVISGNRARGVDVSINSSGNTIQGNFIGTNAVGTGKLPNHGEGVLLAATATTNTIGGPTAVSRNIISGNDGPGVQIGTSTPNCTNNTVQGNYIGTDVGG